jgi:hypothetical protein
VTEATATFAPYTRREVGQAALRGRNSFSTGRLTEFLDASADDVRRAAHNTAQVTRYIRAQLRLAQVSGRGIRQVIAELPLELVSADHSWREIFHALRARELQDDGLLSDTVQQYLRYLSDREESLMSLYRNKLRRH